MSKDAASVQQQDSIPTVSLGAFLDGNATDRRRIAEKVDDICRSIGFLVVEDHAVPQEIIDDAWAQASNFFDLPLEKKLAVRSDVQNCPRGYFPLAGEALARTRGVASLPDQKEAFSCGPLAAPFGHEPNDEFDFFYGANLWPDEPAGFKNAWINYYLAMERLGAQLMQLLAAALQLPDDYFVEYHTHHLGALRGLNYPPVPTKLDAGRQRAGAHSDYGSVTILKPDPGVAGLEVRLPSGQWIAAPMVSSGFIVNLGDLMARWTNDRWVSTLHRVVEPGTNVAVDAPRRQAIAYFMNPNDDAEIRVIDTCLEDGEAPKYPPVLAGRYLIDKFRAANE